MTREQIITIFTDLGIEAPNKGIVTNLLNAFNQEKGEEIALAKTSTKDEIEAKYKDYVKPEDHQKVVDELATEKGKGAVATRKAAYEKAKLNIDDEDIYNLLESKFKDSKDLDKDLSEYVKTHQSFIKVDAPKQKKEMTTPISTVLIGGSTTTEKNPQQTLKMTDAIADYYNSKNN